MLKRLWKQSAATVLACAFVFSSVMPVTVNAQEQGDRRQNLILNRVVKEALVKDLGPETYPVPDELRSDTLAAINDGIVCPDKPHTGPGENPYAWTNYKAVQAGTRVADVIVMFSGEALLREVVLYHFVDSWSADLPAAVQFFSRHLIMDGNMANPTYEENWVEMSLKETTRISDTCYKCRYVIEDISGAPFCDGITIRMIPKDGSKQRPCCVGLYEVEAYDTLEEEGFWDDVVFSSDVVKNVIVGSEEAKDKCKKANAIDGDPLTLWHTDWKGCAESDRYITLELEEKKELTGIIYEARYGSKDGDNNGRIAGYVVEGCSYDDNWFYITSGFLPDREGEHEITFSPVKVKAIRLRGVSTYGNVRDKYMSVAELTLLGREYR